MRELSVWLLVLPDGRVVFQRRSKDMQRSPGLLAFFGGHLDPGETPDKAALRELAEETSLDPSQLQKRHLGDLRITLNDDALFHIYEAEIESADFGVYEGDGAEAYERDVVLQRNDLSEMSRRVLIELWKG